MKCEHVICKWQEYGGKLHYVCQDCRETQQSKDLVTGETTIHNS